MDKNDVVKEIKLMLEDFFVKSIDPKPEDEMEKSEDFQCTQEATLANCPFLILTKVD
jgi:hypothetical protein